MSEEIPKIYAKLVALETVVSDLRQGYLIVNQRYTNALASLKDLTAHASEAAKRSATGALKAAEAAKNASMAATVAHQAEESSLIASAQAAEATKIATDAATEAVKMSNLAADVARTARIKRDAD